MRFPLVLAALAALAACSPEVPDSAAGVGENVGTGYDTYQDYAEAQAARDAALTGSISGDAEPAQTLAMAGDGTDAETLAAETRAALSATGTAMATPVADPVNPPETVTTATGISSENDFQAVGAVRSIEDDAALIAQNRQQYEVIQPTALPARSGNTGPNIVQYALSTRHPVGTQVYRRGGFNKQAKYQRNCAKYGSPDQAQMAFLEKGGPHRDKLGIDPDGDGYACGWDPTPFRAAVSG